VPDFVQAPPSSAIKGEHCRAPSLLLDGLAPHAHSLVRSCRSITGQRHLLDAVATAIEQRRATMLRYLAVGVLFW
jgi:hypothetical protein